MGETNTPNAVVEYPFASLERAPEQQRMSRLGTFFDPGS